ncbi:lysylphosphatidylglycerol synthase transmembrane domain-containing protein [Streptosporangium roseum]|uniref:lysylphosphatidylglycerol synthase transmembrane domain-containing protein n=1 Tax=Streptosporangium roseum TaxID=2001 RepID=UPI00332BAC37
MKNKWVQIGLSVASLALAATLVRFLPQIVEALTGKHVSWSQIGAQFAGLSWPMVALMAVVWLSSLLAYTFVLTASLPGLTHSQALTLNAAGSAVSNLLPFGGAAGVAMTIAMTKGWGFPLRAVVVSTLSSGIWNTMFRFVLPAVGIVALLLSGQELSPAVTNAGWVGSLSLLALVVVVAAALYWDRAAAVLGRALDALARLLPRGVRPAEHTLSRALEKLRADTSEVVRHRWRGLTLGMIFFLGLQWLLLVCCLQATGAYPGLAQTIAVFALSRVLTTALVTPSGTGIMEAGTVGALVFFGAPLDSATAAALLFGFWTYTVEIPFGGLALGAWALLRRRENAASASDKEPISR